MKVVYSLRHRSHHPQFELENGALQEPFEHPGRAEIIRSALAADASFEFVAPDDWGIEPIEAVHDPGLVAFLETAWEDYQQANGYTHDVVPDLFTLPALREGMGPATEPTAIGARLGWWCFETTTPLTHGTYVGRTSVGRCRPHRCRLGAERRSGRLRVVSAPGASRSAAPRTGATASSTTPPWRHTIWQ